MKITKKIIREMVMKALQMNEEDDPGDQKDVVPGSNAEKALIKLTRDQFNLSDETDAEELIGIRDKFNSTAKSNNLTDDDILTVLKAQGVQDNTPALKAASASKFAADAKSKTDPDARFIRIVNKLTSNEIE